jgi:hypothetical protein
MQVRRAEGEVMTTLAVVSSKERFREISTEAVTGSKVMA